MAHGPVVAPKQSGCLERLPFSNACSSAVKIAGEMMDLAALTKGKLEGCISAQARPNALALHRALPPHLTLMTSPYSHLEVSLFRSTISKLRQLWDSRSKSFV